MNTQDRGAAWPVAVGMLCGVGLDGVLPDPRRGHPVAAYGRSVAWVERSVYRPSRARGAAFTLLAVAPVVAGGRLAQRRSGGWRRAVLTGAVTWSVVGGAMLGREAEAIADALEESDPAEARRRLPGLCGRDPESLDEKDIARAVVESVAENTSDAVVAPLFWGALLGVSGLAGYRAVNTLDAMVGHRSPRYERFGWAAARLDDVLNWAPARLTAALATVAAPVAGGTPALARRVWARYGSQHPSPNAGHCEAAFAGALDLRLGGRNVYGPRVEDRPELGEGRRPEPADIRRAVRLARTVNTAAAVSAAAVAVVLAARRARVPTNTLATPAEAPRGRALRPVGEGRPSRGISGRTAFRVAPGRPAAAPAAVGARARPRAVRAGAVGHGVGPLFRRLLRRADPRVGLAAGARSKAVP